MLWKADLLLADAQNATVSEAERRTSLQWRISEANCDESRGSRYFGAAELINIKTSCLK